jgi:hypothetical protein
VQEDPKALLARFLVMEQRDLFVECRYATTRFFSMNNPEEKNSIGGRIIESCR